MTQLCKAFTESKVGFIGSQNCMPMGLALYLREQGVDVTYVVDAPASSTLHRPEYRFPQITYPYPDWILETKPYRYKGLLRSTFPKIVLADVIAFMKDRDILFLNDYGLVLAPVFSSNVRKIAIFSGIELDVYCNRGHVSAEGARGKRYLSYLKKAFLRRTVSNFRRGVGCCDVLSYFPEGLVPESDRRLEELTKGNGSASIPRYAEFNFDAARIGYVKPPCNDVMCILVPVRFFPFNKGLRQSEYKGNDRIIEGVIRFLRRGHDCCVHMFEKGDAEAIRLAKEEVDRYGVASQVVWHRELPFEELLNMYKEADVIIDQVGSHFPGGVTTYALRMARAVIANGRPEEMRRHFGDALPVLHAETADDIEHWLEKLANKSFRADVSERGFRFSVEHMGPEPYLKKVGKALERTRTG